MSKPDMSTTNGKRSRGRKPGPTGPSLRGGSRDARRLCAVILEVLAGQRTPADAAAAVGVSVPRYYALESRALHGLLAACEPRARGPRRSPEREVAALRKQVERLERECTRHQSLLRLSQRAIGVAAVTASRGKNGAKKRSRRPVVRGLKAAQKLRSDTPALPVEKNDAKTS